MSDLSPARKRLAIGIVLVGSALIGERVIALMAGEAEVVDAVARPANSQRGRAQAATSALSAGPQASAVQLERLASRQRALDRVDRDAEPATASGFDPASWQPLPSQAQAAAAAEPPAAPVAPPFPYAYLGGLSENGVRTTFFTQGERVLPVKAGDTVDAVYRVDQMTETLMTLTYLPLNQSLTLALRSHR